MLPSSKVLILAVSMGEGPSWHLHVGGFSSGRALHTNIRRPFGLISADKTSFAFVLEGNPGLEDMVQPRWIF